MKTMIEQMLNRTFKNKIPVIYSTLTLVNSNFDDLYIIKIGTIIRRFKASTTLNQARFQPTTKPKRNRIKNHRKPTTLRAH